jgi:hypothetical protein
MLIVWKLDRLGRSLRGLIATLDELREPGVKFGRKRKLTIQRVRHVRKPVAQNEPPGDVAALFKVNCATLCRPMNP